MAATRNPLLDPMPGDKIRGRVWLITITDRIRNRIFFHCDPLPGFAEKAITGNSTVAAWRSWCKMQAAKVEHVAKIKEGKG